MSQVYNHPLRSWLVLSAAFVLVAGCSYPPADREAFGVQVREWVPVGTSVADAARTMKGKRFHIGREHPLDWWEDQREYLICSRRKVILPFSHRGWRVILKIEEERIADVRTYIYIHGP